jgi:Putative MetA-pathway of phenol degradation
MIAFFAPTGAGSSGQHMWVNEIDLGTTLYLDPRKKWNVSTMVYYDFNRKKNNTDLKVGNILTLAGGLGRSFLKGAANAGVAYGAQWKMTQ